MGSAIGWMRDYTRAPTPPFFDAPDPMQLDFARDFLRLLTQRFVATRCPQVAGSLTFTTLLAIVPLVTVTIALFSNFKAFSKIGTSLKIFLLENLLPDRAGQIIATYALQFSEKAAKLTAIGSVMLVITSLMLLLTIDQVFNHIWGVKRPRTLLARLTTYWFALTVGPLALGGSILATGHLVTTSVAMTGADAWLGDHTAPVVPLLMLAGLFSFLYYAVPNHPVRGSHALIGGIAAAVAFLLMQRAFGLFIAKFPTYTLVYGTFAALPIFLVWLYLSWVVVLLGAILAATLPSFAERKRITPPFPGSRARAALQMLIALADAQATGGVLAFEALQRKASISSEETESVLGEMREAGWVACTDEGEWLLSRSATEIGTAEVIARFAISPAGWRAAGNGEASNGVAARLDDALRATDVPIASLCARDRPPAGQIG